MKDEDFRFPSKPSTEVAAPAKPRREPSHRHVSGDDIAGRAMQLADEIRAHARTEAAQGQLSPTDNALMLRIETFLRNEVGRIGR